jgi:putative membrane protein
MQPEEQEKQVITVEKEELIMRDYLAADRTALANERTYLSYIRTALAFSAGGFGLIKLFPTVFFVVLGWILVGAGIIIAVIGTIRFIQFQKSIGDFACYYEFNGREKKIDKE